MQTNILNFNRIWVLFGAITRSYCTATQPFLFHIPLREGYSNDSELLPIMRSGLQCRIASLRDHDAVWAMNFLDVLFSG